MSAIPGGWLDQEHIDALRRALEAESRRVSRSRDNVHERLRAIDAIGDAHSTRTERDLIALYDGRLAAMAAVTAAFAGVEHGARVEALASPAEEAAQEAEHQTGAELCSCGHERRWHGDELLAHERHGSCLLTECPCGGFVHA